MDLRRLGRSWGALATLWAGLVVVPAVGFGQSCLCGTAADELVADRAGLVREWIVQLPFDSGGWQVEHVTVGDGLVVAVSGDGGVHAVSTAAPPAPGGTAPGVLAWSQRIGKPSGPVFPAGIGPGVVAVARDIDLYALERTNGQVRWQNPLGRLPGSAPAVLGDWVYAPLMNDGVLRTPANPLRAESTTAGAAAAKDAKQKAAAKGRGKKPPERRLPVEKLVARNIDAGGSVDRPPQAVGDAVAWATRAGLLVVLAANETGWERLEFNLNAGPVGAMTIRDETLFVATRGGGLARVALDRAPSRLRAEWFTVLDAVPDSGPLIGGDTLVVSLGEHGLAAYGAADGRLLWRNDAVGTPLAVVGDRAWMLDRMGRLSALDLATGARRERLCVGCFTLPVVNSSTPRLLLASPGGLLVSLAAAVPAAPAAAKRPASRPQAAAEQPAEDGQPAEPAAADGTAPAGDEPPAADAAGGEADETN